MKRVFALIMALVLVFSLSVTAFAAEGTGSITITNATVGDTYRLYKIFDATYSKSADGKTEAVAYTLSDDAIFNYMFVGEGVTDNTEKGTLSNAYFTYTKATKIIERNKDTQNSDIFAYLTTMVRTLDPDGTKSLQFKENVSSETVTFSELGYGYYLIDKAADDNVEVAVTITSNTPSVNVIDKNQIPGTDFVKLVQTADGKWVGDTSASIGDIVKFNVSFEATNYHGEKQIRYYTINDTKGSALWVEFNTISVKVGNTELKQGYYHATEGEHKTNEWEYLGTWTDEKNPDNADWYLIHRGFDEFDIVIPWMTAHDFNATTNGFEMTYGEGAISKYTSPVDVSITYSAVIEPDATIGNLASNNLWNTADLTWTSNSTDGPDDPSTTTIETYALGLIKTDADTQQRLANAVFTLYSDKNCTTPVYVIPTAIKGVYIVDDLNAVVSGEKRLTAREKYAAYLDAYLNGETQKNVVTTEVNGKVLILGLEAGTYYLKEDKAPNGYNTLPNPVEVAVGETNNTFFIIADGNGNVVDAQSAVEGYTKYTYLATSTTVENSKGVELPSTGGAGTMMLITFGSLIAMAFAVLMITQKKMSVYHD